MLVVVFTAAIYIIQVFLALLRLGGHRQIALCPGIAHLHLVGQQKLSKQPACQHLLRIFLVEYAHGRALGNHFGILRIKLGNRHDFHLEIRNIFFLNIQ